MAPVAPAFSTGMAAIQAVLMGLLSAGDHCIVSDVAYGGTYRFCTKVLAALRRGVHLCRHLEPGQRASGACVTTRS